MAITTNYHTHTLYCDGKAGPEAFVRAAIERNFTALGFSAHAPAPRQESWCMAPGRVTEYLREITALKKKYAGQIEIYSGMEVDYLPGVLGASSPEISTLGLDYTIGGVHIIQIESTGDLFTLDGPRDEFENILKLQFGGDRKALVEHYFLLISAMVREHRPDIIAHFDLVKVRNRGEEYYSEADPWYRKAAAGALAAAAEAGSVLEINTGGRSRGKSDTFYPSSWVLKEARKRNIPVTINSDVHVPEGIDAMFTEAAETAKRAGYSEKRVLLEKKWQDVPL
jgi:histidinol-phosphatase (PHP family)